LPRKPVDPITTPWLWISAILAGLVVLLLIFWPAALIWLLLVLGAGAAGWLVRDWWRYRR